MDEVQAFMILLTHFRFNLYYMTWSIACNMQKFSNWVGGGHVKHLYKISTLPDPLKTTGCQVSYYLTALDA